MAFRAIAVAVLLSSLPIAGCGTLTNLAPSPPGGGGHIPFGGVSHDMACIEQAATGQAAFWTSQAGAEPAPHPQVGLILLCAADLPLSFLGDVVTWPYTVSYTYINQPVPVPPVTPAPAPPVVPPTAGGQAPNSPVETLPEPRKTP